MIINLYCFGSDNLLTIRKSVMITILNILTYASIFILINIEFTFLLKDSSKILSNGSIRFN